jgi:hypothetical protein
MFSYWDLQHAGPTPSNGPLPSWAEQKPSNPLVTLLRHQAQLSHLPTSYIIPKNDEDTSCLTVFLNQETRLSCNVALGLLTAESHGIFLSVFREYRS